MNYTYNQKPSTESELRIALKALGKKDKQTKEPLIIPRSHKELVEILKEATQGISFNHKILNAIEEIDRSTFFDWKSNSINSKTINPYTFMAPIYAKTQTIPSPHLVLSQLDDLDIKDGQNILEIGAGSGYNAIIAAKSADDVHVKTTEIDPELSVIAKNNIQRTKMQKYIEVHSGEHLGIPNNIFDRIYSSVAATKLEQVELLLDQLSIGGKMRLPIVKLGNYSVIKDSRLWIPGENIEPEEIYIADSKREFSRQAAYLFQKIDSETIQYQIVVSNALGPNLK